MKGNDLLQVNEIFKSIQGESSYAGLPCVFVRLAGCNLSCSYCDTRYALREGEEMGVEDVAAVVERQGSRLVEITGGEPLLQPAVHRLIAILLEKGYEVLLETNGTVDLEPVDSRVIKIMDLKCPGSGMAHQNLYGNVELLSRSDEVKFVIGDGDDYRWAKDMVDRFGLLERCAVLFAPVYGRMEPSELARWMLEDSLEVRLQLQIHKYIWEPRMRGV